MKKVIAICLLTLLSVADLSKVTFLVQYLVQYDYYTTVLCENKAVAESTCNGSCHLNKQLNIQESQQEDPEAPAPIAQLEEKQPYELLDVIDCSAPLTHLRLSTRWYLNQEQDGYLRQTFQPPA